MSSKNFVHEQSYRATLYYFTFKKWMPVVCSIQLPKPLSVEVGKSEKWKWPLQYVYLDIESFKDGY